MAAGGAAVAVTGAARVARPVWGVAEVAGVAGPVAVMPELVVGGLQCRPLQQLLPAIKNES